MNPDLEHHPDLFALRRIVLQLSLVSHAPIQGYNFAPNEVGRGDRWRKSQRNDPIPHLGQHQSKGGDTMIPRGDVDRKGDLTPEYRQKSDMYFRKRIPRLRNERELAALLKEAQDAQDAWRRTPEVAGVEHERGSYLWKCEIADTDGPVEPIKRKYTISQATIYRYRAKYRGLRKRAA